MLKQNTLLKYLELNEENLVQLAISVLMSAFGARICYFDGHPLKLFFDEKISEKQQTIKFLSNLKKKGHTSIFAHGPVVINEKIFLDQFSSSDLLSMVTRSLYKVWKIGGDCLLFNLRHVAENSDNEKFEKFLRDICYSINNWPNELFERIEIIPVSGFPHNGSELDYNKVKVIFEDLNKYGLEKISDDEVHIVRTPQVFIFRFGKNSQNIVSNNWIWVLVHNCSRIFSHQFVRHTWINFSQRSHRYTKVNTFVVPESFCSELQSCYIEAIKHVSGLYKQLLNEKKISKEDARYLLPNGSATTIFASAPVIAWQDFISKRLSSKAQEEIRQFAYLLSLHIG